MTVGKKIRKTARIIGKKLKRRYVKKGNLNLKQVAGDVYKIQRMLNVEHKHLDIKIGFANPFGTQPLLPTKGNPIIQALTLPTRGTGFNERIGNQIRIVHMTAKYEFKFKNNSDLIQRTTARAQILFAKDPSDVPSIDQLYDPDANGQYTPMSFVNTQEYKKYTWIKALTAQKSHLQPTNRYISYAPNTAIGTQDDVINPSTLTLNHADYFVNRQTKTSIRVLFKNGTDQPATNRPYLLLTSDVIGAAPAGQPYDPISISCSIRLTYVDN